jgi:hypothetical protein
MHQLIIEMYAESLQNGWWCLFACVVCLLILFRVCEAAETDLWGMGYLLNLC